MLILYHTCVVVILNTSFVILDDVVNVVTHRRVVTCNIVGFGVSVFLNVVNKLGFDDYIVVTLNVVLL